MDSTADQRIENLWQDYLAAKRERQQMEQALEELRESGVISREALEVIEEAYVLRAAEERLKEARFKTETAAMIDAVDEKAEKRHQDYLMMRAECAELQRDMDGGY